jgi:hypothetical protein
MGYMVAFPLSTTLVLHPGINLLSLPENDLKNIFLGNFLQPSNGNPLPTINQPPHIEILL